VHEQALMLELTPELELLRELSLVQQLEEEPF
jgi:hypothetical protein